MTVGSLFAGIGGFDLGLERAGFEIRWQVEIDPFCRAVLEKHWPNVRRYEDVRTVGAGLEAVDVLCGGFPCQDISVAGRGEGIDGARSGLWREFDRLIGELRPRYVVVENVSALLVRGLDRVLGDLAARGFDAEWDCLPASAFGAPHRRDRVWLVAYPCRERRQQVTRGASSDEAADEGWTPAHDHVAASDGQGDRAADVANAASGRRQRRRAGFSEATGGRAQRLSTRSSEDAGDVADTASGARQRETPRQAGHAALSGEVVSDSDSSGREQQRRVFPIRAELASPECRGWWEFEPDVGRVAHGVPARVDRLRGLGNAVVPQIVEWIGRRILEAEEMKYAECL